MLQTNSVEPGTLQLLRQLLLVPALENFSLVVGTSLALRYGHRMSVDLDLFSSTTFENEALAKSISEKFPHFSYRSLQNPIGLFGMIGPVKVDFVRYHIHPLLQPLDIIDGIRMFSAPDIFAMKIAAILRRGVKKDFYDIAELLKHFSLEQSISFYTQKYPTQQLLISIPYALTYFADAEESEDPVSLNGETWTSVKKTIQQKVNDYLK